MENKITAGFLMLFTLFVCVACVWCLTPVFSSFGTAWTFICQYISFQILFEVISGIYKDIKRYLDNKKNNN